MNKDAKIYVAGHRGLVGSALVRKLEREGFTNIITRTHSELDLTRQADVEDFFEKEYKRLKEIRNELQRKKARIEELEKNTILE